MRDCTLCLIVLCCSARSGAGADGRTTLQRQPQLQPRAFGNGLREQVAALEDVHGPLSPTFHSSDTPSTCTNNHLRKLIPTRRPQICLEDLQGLCRPDLGPLVVATKVAQDQDPCGPSKQLLPKVVAGSCLGGRSMVHKCDEASCGGYLCHECFLEDAERCAGCREVFCGTQSCGQAGGIPTCDRCERAWCGPCVTSGAADAESQLFAGLRSHEICACGACPWDLPACDFCEQNLCVGVWVANTGAGGLGLCFDHKNDNDTMTL